MGLTWEQLKVELLERYGGRGEGNDEIRGWVQSFIALGSLSHFHLMNVTQIHGGSEDLGFSENMGTMGGFGLGSGGKEVDVGGGNVTKERLYGPRTGQGFSTEKKRMGPKDKGVTHLTYQELMERKQKGLFYKYGDPFHPRHQCLDKQMRVMVLDDLSRAEEVNGECSVMGSLSIGKGWRPQTMRLKGKINGVPILILVDSGATYNFISKKLVASMGLKSSDISLVAWQQKLCYVAVDYEAELLKDTQASFKAVEGLFTLSKERFQTGEILFQPRLFGV
ncbi:Actin-related protein 8, partial [Mucuna pruriens]